MQCERVCPRRTFAASRGGCEPGTVRRVLSLSSRRGERGFSPASRARGCRRYQGRRACRPAAKRPDRATWVVPRLELFRPSYDKLMGRPFLFCPNVKTTPRTFTRRFTLAPKELAKQHAPAGTEDRIYQNWCDMGIHTQIDRKKPFTIVMPPPNVTGQPHMGHAMDETRQDILTRWLSGCAGPCRAVGAWHRPCVHCHRGQASSPKCARRA